MDKEQPFLLKANGERIEVEPANGRNFTLEELYKLIGCDTIQVIMLKDKRLMIMDEDGKLTKKTYNVKATLLGQSIFGWNDYIVGDVVVCSRKLFK